MNEGFVSRPSPSGLTRRTDFLPAGGRYPGPTPGKGVGFDRQPGRPASERRGTDNKRQRYLNRLRRGPTNGQYARGGTKGPGGDYSGMYGGLTYQQLMGRINALRPGTKLPQRLPGGRPIVNPRPGGKPLPY